MKLSVFYTISTLALMVSVLLASSCNRPSSRDTSGIETATNDARFADSPQDLMVVGFWNVENLFDVDDDPSNPGDDEFLPASAKRWTAKRYQEKLGRMSKAIAEIGAEVVAGGPAILGLAEVENARVIRDLAAQPALAKSDYDVIHIESPDFRGIDVGLMYRKSMFAPLSVRALHVSLGMRGDSTERTTRDVLYVKGLLEGDTIHYFVNHWPSRRGGETASRPGREAAAAVVRAVVDSLRMVDRMADIVIVGDFNDDPTDASLTKVLRAADKRADAGQTGLYNPMLALFRRGEGTLGYRDSWNLFDQIIVSEGLAKTSENWALRDARVFRQGYLLQPAGRYKGYPLRTFVGDEYMSGYSDHLPAYAILTRPKK